MARRRIVVTGLGIVSPVGNTVEEAWQNILAGRSGIGPMTRFDASTFPSRVAGQVKNFDIHTYIPPKEARRVDEFIHFGMAAGIQAVQDAGLDQEQPDGERIGVCIGSGIGGLATIEAGIKANPGCLEEHPQFVLRKVSPFFVPAIIINMISGNLSIRFGFKGPNLAIVSACTTGTHSIGEAMRMIEYGDADVMVAGGSDACITMTCVGGFSAARALSTNFNDQPEVASRPWDKDRDGFVIGEGAGALVLEEYEHAKARGAKMYAELIGYGMSGDAHHITAPDMDGPRRCMVSALNNAGVNPDAVQYLNAHGTSTPLGDKNETDAIKAVFGSHAKKLVVNSTKSMTGHLLGGAGGIESLFAVLALHHQVSPPTINIFQQDPECDLDYCANTAREMKIDIALNNNFGFGGTNGTLVFKRI